jgi:large subunit ribosomal protein L35
MQAANAEDRDMPKIKTHQGAAGRFEVRKSGKLKRRRAGYNHLLQKKRPKQKRRLSTETFVDGSDERRMKYLLGKK